MKSLIILVTILFVHPTFAQVDPLMRSRGQAPDKEDLDSSRYSVRPTASSPKVEKEEEKAHKVAETKAEAPKVEKKVEEKPAAPEAAVQQEAPKTPEKTGVADKVQDAILGGTQEEVDDYRKILHPLDTRLNLFELSLAPAYIYNNSSSSYWFHNFYTAGPGISIDAITWFSPFFGLQTAYTSSMSTEVRGNPEGTKFSKVEHQWFDTALRFRKFFGISRKSAQLTFGVGYSEYQFKVPSDSTYRVSSKTSGLKLAVEAGVPSTNTTSWTLGLHLKPRVKYTEKSTALDLKSGIASDSNEIGLSIGSRYTFDRYNQIFWKVTHSVEKTLFSGVANTTDPLSSVTPEGVSITNSMTIFTFGYIWGN